jgi:hypothetical protein
MQRKICQPSWPNVRGIGMRSSEPSRSDREKPYLFDLEQLRILVASFRPFLSLRVQVCDNVVGYEK